MKKTSMIFFGILLTAILVPLSSQFTYAESATIVVDSFDVDYTIENGFVESIFLDPDFTELIITMDTASDGTIEITIPRSLLDAKFETLDDIFFI